MILDVLPMVYNSYCYFCRGDLRRVVQRICMGPSFIHVEWIDRFNVGNTRQLVSNADNLSN